MKKEIRDYLDCVVFTEQKKDEEIIFSEEAIAIATQDVTEFLKLSGDLLAGEDMVGVMYDFWLTRNGHGAGFWDGDYGKEQGEALTKVAKSFDSLEFYVGDDGLGYFN